ncbi:hypothetical protein ABID82_003410 [Methylobacterium sp. PvP062]|uniref:Uncharacterized protein n=2 Tax=Methylobacterium TaxID=407 RepID=A0ABV2NCJ9_9HYPH|nr:MULTISPECIES: hypothetical protein [Methylobacterium]MBP2492553.1 hypothetical protein [Methylobacterium sp. PvP105]MBP2501075.1 hypothetical protein [Methylobacterium sp. PvP109]MCX7333486.1 hypothetical protein [Hyphomicrobiales bacterium]GJE36507.1 hypothetical protein KHHGKMAE_0558 [Methylobacterium persicinum]
MSKPLLRLVETTSWESEGFPGSSTPVRQLSLFDHRPVRRVSCLPMAEVHGVTFKRAVFMSPHALVVDARLYPYFDLPGLSRPSVFRLFEDLSCRYLHVPIDLRPPRDQSARWQRRQSVREAMARVVGQDGNPMRSSTIVLVNRLPDVDVLDETLRGVVGDGDPIWKVQPHDALALTGNGS